MKGILGKLRACHRGRRGHLHLDLVLLLVYLIAEIVYELALLRMASWMCFVTL